MVFLCGVNRKMPIFEYECTRLGCKKVEEFIETPNSLPVGGGLRKCTCGAPMLKKISATSFHLKGSGWAKDNYQGGN